ncbi:hypothetical protein K503DRAFT_556601 [Rhizopogon vinicolor AM-OR11-026]|uniref:Uncharacterized protein n=1 Tax=Rhizopogon vinicolor AM-OR11-026 TaxID=1314800 RepID=A0A1B7MKD1_9AGAM|nr:hypothetical protein K503DRAFT_556601 [Rhizopogon vinicolor AM-OR11-026]
MLCVTVNQFMQPSWMQRMSLPDNYIYIKRPSRNGTNPNPNSCRPVHTRCVTTVHRHAYPPGAFFWSLCAPLWDLALSLSHWPSSELSILAKYINRVDLFL